MDPIFTGILISVSSVLISTGIITFFRWKWNTGVKKDEEIKKLCNEITILKKAVWRLNKTILIMAKIIDAQTDELHPEIVSDLKSITEELLNDSVNDS